MRQNSNTKPRTATPAASGALSDSINEECARIAHILNHPNTPTCAVDTMWEILTDAANESNVGINHPEIFNVALPVILETLNEQYAAGIVHCLRAVAQVNCPAPVIESARKAVLKVRTAQRRAI
jgi:hypothetical protein